MYQLAEIASPKDGTSSQGDKERQGEIVARENKGAVRIVKPDVKLQCTKLVTAEKISLVGEKKELGERSVLTEQRKSEHNSILIDIKKNVASVSHDYVGKPVAMKETESAILNKYFWPNAVKEMESLFKRWKRGEISENTVIECAFDLMNRMKSHQELMGKTLTCEIKAKQKGVDTKGLENNSSLISTKSGTVQGKK